MTTKKKTKKTKKFTVTVKDEATTQAPSSADAATTTQAPASANAVAKVALSSTTPKDGETLTTTVTYNSNTNVKYTWFMGDSATAITTVISSANAASLALTSDMVGKFIKVQVTGEDGSTAAAATTAPVAAKDEAELAITASQDGASKIVVKANKAVSKTDTVTVKRGTQTIESTFTVDESGLIVTITTGIKLADATYTVTITPADTKKAAASADFVAKAATLEKIDFVGDSLVLADSTFTSASVKIFGYDSFGDKVALAALTPYTTKGKVKYEASTNEIVVSSTQTALFTTGEKVTVTAIYQDGTTVRQVSKALTISGMATVSKLTFGELQTTNSALKGKPVTMNNMKTGTYYKTVVAENQYGDTLSAKQLNNMLQTTERPAGTLFVTPSIADGAWVYLSSFDTSDKGEVIARFNLGNIGMPGKQTFVYTAVGGYQTTDEITVIDNPFIAKLTIDVPELYGNKESAITVSAVDQDGNALDLYNYVAGNDTVTGRDFEFNDMNNATKQKTKITVPASLTLNVKRNTVKKTVAFSLTAGSNETVNNIPAVITATTAKPDMLTVNCSIQPNAHPYSLSAKLKSTDSNSAVIKSGGSINLYNEVLVLDQYGASYGYLSAAKAATITAAADKIDATTDDLNTSYKLQILDKDGALIDGGIPSKGKYTAQLWYDSDLGGSAKATLLDSKDFTVTVADTKYSGFTASLNSADKLLYVGDAANGKDSESIKVTASDSTGNVVTLTPGSDYTVSFEDLPAGVNFDVIANATEMKNGTIAVTNGVDPNTNKLEGNITANIYRGADLVTSVKVPYSNAAPVTGSYVCKKGPWATGSSYDLDDGITLADYANKTVGVVATAGAKELDIKDAGTTVYSIRAVDQYGLSNFVSRLGSRDNFNNGDNLDDYGDITLSGTLTKSFKLAFDATTGYTPIATRVEANGLAIDDDPAKTTATGADALTNSSEIVITGFTLYDQHNNPLDSSIDNLTPSVTVTKGAGANTTAASAEFETDSHGNGTITITLTAAANTGDKITVKVGGSEVTVQAPSTSSTAAWSIVY